MLYILWAKHTLLLKTQFCGAARGAECKENVQCTFLARGLPAAWHDQGSIKKAPCGAFFVEPQGVEPWSR